jgi:uncharacterized protein with HEPN domain
MSKGRQAAIDRIRHMVVAAEAIAGYVARGRAAFDTDSAVREAIVYQIVVIGEAAKAVIAADPSFATEVREIEWSLLARMRDKVTHQYWAVDREIVWSTAERDVPTIRHALSQILDK